MSLRDTCQLGENHEESIAGHMACWVLITRTGSGDTWLWKVWQDDQHVINAVVLFNSVFYAFYFMYLIRVMGSLKGQVMAMTWGS